MEESSAFAADCFGNLSGLIVAMDVQSTKHQYTMPMVTIRTATTQIPDSIATVCTGQPTIPILQVPNSMRTDSTETVGIVKDTTEMVLVKSFLLGNGISHADD